MRSLSELAEKLERRDAHLSLDEAAAALREAEQLLRDIVAQKTYITRKNMLRIRALIGEK